jgi:hypothetical protein
VNKSLDELNQPLKTKENAKQLKELSHHVSGKSSPAWKALGVGLLFLGCASLVVVGALGAIPSGGVSVLASAIAIAGLIGSSMMIARGSEKGLAKSVTDFKDQLKNMKKKEQEECGPLVTNTSIQ